MLALKENNKYSEYRTLNQDIYVGGKKISEIWLGNKLIYPEDGIKINEDFYELDKLPNNFGNVYDTGIDSSKDLEVEIIFKVNYNLDESENPIADADLNTNRAFFGTHDNSSSFPTNRDYYPEKTKFHFIINGNYKISFRFGNSYAEIHPRSTDYPSGFVLTDQEKLGVFWIKIYNDGANKILNFGCGDTVGVNKKGEASIPLSAWNSDGSQTGGNLWVNGHNQGQANINTTPTVVRKDSSGNPVDYGAKIKEDIARTKFFYIKIKKTGGKFWEFIPQTEGNESLIPDTGAANANVYLKKYTYKDNNYNATTDKIFSFAYIKVNTTH